HDFQADALLQSDSVIDGPVFDQFEFSSSDGSSDEFLLSRKQLRWAEQATNDIGVDANHNLLPPALHRRSSADQLKLGRSHAKLKFFRSREMGPSKEDLVISSPNRNVDAQ